ncbi:hypothetical protein GCM10023191_101850 [Actinoallomurus oryzae]|uniref:Uncharacterized protein n=1 Tax=Actinoallomurus oryzae TaxID=502180 RepID=A0ABP8R9F7_9ACTN
MAEDHATRLLADFADDIGLTIGEVLARRRYAYTGNRRSLHGYL